MDEKKATGDAVEQCSIDQEKKQEEKAETDLPQDEVKKEWPSDMEPSGSRPAEGDDAHAEGPGDDPQIDPGVSESPGE